MSKTTTSILGKLRCLGIFFTDGQRARQPEHQCLWSLAETPYFTIDPGWLKGYARPNSDLFLSSLHPPDKTDHMLINPGSTLAPAQES